MEQLNNLDVVFLIIVGISALVGIARGMTKEILSIIGWVLAAAALYYLVPIVEPIAQTYIASKMMANIVAGLAVLIVFSLIWILTVDKISSVIRSSTLSALDRILGFVFGAARGILIIILIALLITTVIPEESKKGTFAESQYFQLAKANIDPLVSLVPEEWVKSIKEKTESLGLGAAKDKDTEKAKEDEAKSTETAKEGEVTEKTAETATDENTPDEETKEASDEATAAEDSDAVSTIDSNLEVLKKSGEELFNDLVQPKPAGEEGDEMPDSSDLDQLLDGLEDLVVSTEGVSDAPESISQKITDKVIDKVAEKVADKIVKDAAPAQ